MDCSGLPTEVSEGLKSFPSGHSSHVFAGLGFLALYLAGKLRCFVPAMRAPGLRLIIAIFPLFIAALIAVSRICDYKHHWQDVVVGSLLGFGCAFLAYRQYYSRLSGTHAGSPMHSVKLRHTSEVDSTEGNFV
uniref:phospholipid phosphatase 5 n=1 Tax=Myxine glutinosa TaxID=7769 RepID=UPI0035902D8D